MKVDLQINKCEEKKLIFNVIFHNDSNNVVRLPVDAISRSGDRIGLRFFLNETCIEPIDFKIISPRDEPTEKEILSRAQYEISFTAQLEEKLPSVAALTFDHAVYKIELGKLYKVKFVWHDMKSDTVDWVAE